MGDGSGSDFAFRLDRAFLVDVHLDQLPPEEGNLMLAHVFSTLEQRVGVRLAMRMSDSELDEFESLVETGDEEEALKWLDASIPDYRDIVQHELDLLRAEIRQVAPAIIAFGGLGR